MTRFMIPLLLALVVGAPAWGAGGNNDNRHKLCLDLKQYLRTSIALANATKNMQDEKRKKRDMKGALKFAEQWDREVVSLEPLINVYRGLKCSAVIGTQW
jgi:hypothetical protein